MSVSICVASGKGGAGKSTVTANLGACLARRGHTVTIIDTDIGLRSQDALLSLENQVVYDLVDVASKDCRLDQALLSHPSIPGHHSLPGFVRWNRNGFGKSSGNCSGSANLC